MNPVPPVTSIFVIHTPTALVLILVWTRPTPEPTRDDAAARPPYRQFRCAAVHRSIPAGSAYRVPLAQWHAAPGERRSPCRFCAGPHPADGPPFPAARHASIPP